MDKEYKILTVIDHIRKAIDSQKIYGYKSRITGIVDLSELSQNHRKIRNYPNEGILLTFEDHTKLVLGAVEIEQV